MDLAEWIYNVETSASCWKEKMLKTGKQNKIEEKIYIIIQQTHE